MWTGGAGEHGADIVVKIADHFADSTWLIWVQVKDHPGEENDLQALNQLREAFSHYSTEGAVIEVVLITTADREAEGFAEQRRTLAQQLAIPVVIVLRKRLIEIIADAPEGGFA